MNLLKHVAVGISFTVLFNGLACSRSEEFNNSSDYYSDYPKNYYGRKGGAYNTPTQRIEKMGQPKKRTVIFDFFNDTPVSNSTLGPFAAEELKRGLFVTRRINIPEDIKTNLVTRDFIQGEKVKVSQLISEGKRMGVAVLVIGRIGKLVFRQRGEDIGVFRQKQSLAAADVELKIFDVQGGREIVAVGRSGEASSNSTATFESENLHSTEFRVELAKLAVRNAVAQLVPTVIQAVEKMTWRGRIAKVVGPKVYVSAGRKSGLVAGDILKVMMPGDDIYDPSSGAYLGQTEGQLKGTLELRDFVGDDASVGMVHTGGHFDSGDVVELY